MRTEVGDLRVGITRALERLRTADGEPEKLCVQARIVRGVNAGGKVSWAAAMIADIQ
jgi:hypothetical protein